MKIAKLAGLLLWNFNGGRHRKFYIRLLLNARPQRTEPNRTEPNLLGLAPLTH